MKLRYTLSHNHIRDWMTYYVEHLHEPTLMQKMPVIGPRLLAELPDQLAARFTLRKPLGSRELELKLGEPWALSEICGNGELAHSEQLSSIQFIAVTPDYIFIPYDGIGPEAIVIVNEAFEQPGSRETFVDELLKVTSPETVHRQD